MSNTTLEAIQRLLQFSPTSLGLVGKLNRAHPGLVEDPMERRQRMIPAQGYQEIDPRLLKAAGLLPSAPTPTTDLRSGVTQGAPGYGIDIPGFYNQAPSQVAGGVDPSNPYFGGSLPPGVPFAGGYPDEMMQSLPSGNPSPPSTTPSRGGTSSSVSGGAAPGPATLGPPQSILPGATDPFALPDFKAPSAVDDYNGLMFSDPEISDVLIDLGAGLMANAASGQPLLVNFGGAAQDAVKNAEYRAERRDRKEARAFDRAIAEYGANLQKAQYGLQVANFTAGRQDAEWEKGIKQQELAIQRASVANGAANVALAGEELKLRKYIADMTLAGNAQGMDDGTGRLVYVIPGQGSYYPTLPDGSAIPFKQSTEIIEKVFDARIKSIQEQADNGEISPDEALARIKAEGEWLLAATGN